MKAHKAAIPRQLCRWFAAAIVIAALFFTGAAAEIQKAFAQPPSKQGWLVLEGGGKLRGTEFLRRFIELAGGKNARLVVIPSAAIHNMGRTYNAEFVAHETQWWRDLTGIQDVTQLHTDDRAIADSESFVAPLRKATALFILGGDDVWLYNSYVGTRTEIEIHNLFARGGVIGGTSAGATVLGATSYDLRAPRQGFNLLKNTSINPHFFNRHREGDMARFVQQHPGILGIGVDESTAVFIHGSDVEVVGEGNVGIFDGKSHGNRNYILFSNGDKFDLQEHSRTAADDVVNRPDRKWFMGSVLIARNGKIVFEKNYGDANREQHIHIGSATRYPIGSLSKQFTAAAILILEARGKLRTSDPVRRYLSDAPAAWDRVTVYNLLTHTSGIPDYINSPDFDSIKAKQMTPDEIIRRFRDKPLDFAPGVKEDYSNSNYAVLGRIIESVSGQSYAAFMRANIFQPLGMKDSGVDTGQAQIENEAIGYALDGAAVSPAAYVNMSIGFGAGAIYSSTEDMLRWEQGLFGGKLLSPAALRKMTTTFLNGYACGLHVGDFDSRKVIYHSGGIDGFSSYMAYYPDEKLTVIALSNVRNRQMAAIVNELAKIVLRRVPLPET